ncbi:MAG TPA: trypsin-like peptidase domain-containing protein [Tepidisphaeraceae bacterium]|jgi:S1-C subfamily serine protease
MKHGSMVATAIVLFLSGLVWADTLTLSDGSTLEGKVLQQGDKYWIKLSSGESRTVAKSQVTSWNKGDAAAAAPAGGTKTTTIDVGSSAGAAAKPGVALSFQETKSRAEKVDAPLAAVGLWQSFIDQNPESADLPTAKTELEKWKKLDKDKAEKINGKWVGGDDRKKLLEKVNKLLTDAEEMQQNSQTVKAVQKLEEAVRLYPNSFRANFELGYYCISKAVGSGSNQRLDQAIRSLEQATKLRPSSAAAWSNLAIAYNFRGKYEQSVLTAYKAAQMDDDKDIVQNLVNSIVLAPPGMRENNSKVRPIMEEAFVLAGKRGVGTTKSTWTYVRPKGAAKGSDTAADDDKDTRPGVIGNGSGFLVSANGYVVTNRHVAQVKNCIFMCRFADGSEKSAKVVAIDDDADIALLKIEPEKGTKFPYLTLAEADAPGPGAECSALGYPVANVMNYAMQVTSGTVSSVSESDPYHVTLTAKITHGNSGGPLVDKYGNVIGVVSAGLTAYTETYGKALSAGQVRKFLDKVKDKIEGTTIANAKAGGTAMSTEDIYKKDSPAVLCVILIRSGGPGAGADE